MKRVVLFICIVNFFLELSAQNAQIQVGKTTIALNRTFQITITLENERLKNYSSFPDIKGFIKQRVSNSTRTNIINGHVSITQSIIQSYTPTKEGKFRLPDFSMKINDQTIQVKGRPLTVIAPIQNQPQYYNDPWADLFGGPRNTPQEYTDVKADAFFSINTDKKEVYTGEGFNLSISFFVSTQNQAEMKFYQISEQLAEVLKQVKPINCWEESFEIEEITPNEITIGNKQFREYRIYQATFYPLSTKNIHIPSVGLKMIKYKRSKNRFFFFGHNRKQDFETFFSKQRDIKVKPLPPHPLKDKVNVGNYKLREKTSAKKIDASENFIYEFSIQGEGNIAALREPQINKNDDFIFYSPNIEQQITRANSRVFGNKNFKFYVEPQEPGEYHLADYVHWIYFNPQKHSYDTLRSKTILYISGQSRKNNTISHNDLGNFYDDLIEEDNRLKEMINRSWIVIVLNVMSTLLFLGSIAIFLKKRKD